MPFLPYEMWEVTMQHILQFPYGISITWAEA